MYSLDYKGFLVLTLLISVTSFVASVSLRGGGRGLLLFGDIAVPAQIIYL